MRDNLSHRNKVFPIWGPGTGPYETSVDGSFLVRAGDHRGGEAIASPSYLVQRPGAVPIHISLKRLCSVYAVKRGDQILPPTWKLQVDMRSTGRMPTVSQSNCAPQHFPPDPKNIRIRLATPLLTSAQDSGSQMRTLADVGSVARQAEATMVESGEVATVNSSWP